MSASPTDVAALSRRVLSIVAASAERVRFLAGPRTKPAVLASLAAACILAPVARPHAQTPAFAPVPKLDKVASDYLLNCGGCHGENGASNSRLVPNLRDQVGYYLNSATGREYLVRLPNVAFSTMTDQELADVLNFAVFGLGGSSVPARATPFTPTEVARLRKRPLNEVSLIDYRRGLVARLIAQHHGSAALRVYGTDRP
jgi:cytochrome c553